MKRCLAWVVIGLMGCTGGGGEPASAPSPEQRFAALEAALLGASAVELDFEVIAEGALEVSITGHLATSVEGHQNLQAVGTFGGAPVEVMLTADPGGIRWGGVDDPTEGAALPEVREALLVGLTRMGILHNVARLTAGAPPDHAEAGVEGWVVVGAFRPGDRVPAGANPVPLDAPGQADADGLAFDITVAGVPSGAATLWIDGEGLPLERRQTVAFPDGEMRVTERYTAVRIAG